MSWVLTEKSFRGVQGSTLYLLAGVVSAESHLGHLHLEVITPFASSLWINRALRNRQNRKQRSRSRIKTKCKIFLWSLLESSALTDRPGRAWISFFLFLFLFNRVCELTGGTSITTKILTFYVEDTAPQCSSDGGEGRLLRHIEEVLLCGWTGDGFDLFDQVLRVDVVSDVITQDLQKKKEAPQIQDCKEEEKNIRVKTPAHRNITSWGLTSPMNIKIIKI